MNTVCGLDVHKDSVFCCIICADGQKIQHKFGVLTEDLITMRDLMVSEGVEECAMESTSIYWIPIWRVLEKSVHLHLVNPYFIKQLPGKKSDVKDAEWIATCLQKDLIASSFVPDDKIQRLRQYDRRIFDLNASISRNLVKLDQCVQRCNIRISNYISTTDSKGYRSIVKLISQGVTDASVLVEHLHGRTINKYGREVLMNALTGVVNDTDIDIIAQPPGKKLQLLSLLSGGERALTAIALLFAILKLKPTAFCILDEIETSLDEVNVSTLAQYVQRYSKDTQFIMITHRKGSMEVCNALYGVAMEERGISKVVSARFNG